MSIMDKLNSGTMYLIVGVVIAFVAVLCVVYAVRAYRAGIKMGIDRVKMNRAVSASATFAILPAVGILIGVIALAGSLGIPLPWLRLSVIGALHYETQVAQVAAESVGISLSASEMTEEAFVTIAFLMALCICWGMVFSIIFTKRYSKKLMINNANEAAVEAVVEPDPSRSDEAVITEMSATEAVLTPNAAITTSGTPPETEVQEGKKKKSKFNIAEFGDSAMNAMFIGLVSAYIGSYIGDIKADGNWLPLAVAAVGALAMAGFIWLKEKRHLDWVDNFSIAGSMLIAMASAILFAQFM